MAVASEAEAHFKVNLYIAALLMDKIALVFLVIQDKLNGCL